MATCVYGRVLVLFALVFVMGVGCKEAKEEKENQVDKAKDVKITPSCTMNGFGKGQCQFTNKGEDAGSVCGQVNVVDAINLETVKISSASSCSGEVKPRSSVTVPFSIPGVRGVCSKTSYGSKAASWTDVCSFDWFPDEESKTYVAR